MRAGPPDRKMAPSGSSVAAVQKKLSARWISSTMSSVTEPSTCSAAAGSAPPAARPCFNDSASAGDTPSWRTSASLYSAPPTGTSPVNVERPPLRMLIEE